MLTLKKVAVTGGLASGKSSVCRIFEDWGAYVVSADKIVHQLLSPHTAVGKKIVRELGPEIVSGDKLDRAKIAEKVFTHPDKLQNLENIIHPAVFDEIEKQYQQIKHQKRYHLFVAEIPLLYESEKEHLFDYVLAVVADPALCRQRFEIEKNYSSEEFDRRMLKQLHPLEKAAKADHIIYNNGDLKELNENVMKTINLIKGDSF